MLLAAIQNHVSATPPFDILTGQGFGLLLGLLAIMSIVPFVMTLTTSFAKFVIVLGLVRQALGTQQTPPNMIVTGIALILTIHVMWPVGEQAYANYVQAQASREPSSEQAAGGSTVSTEELMRVLEAAQDPIHGYLARNSSPKFVKTFEKLAHAKQKGDAPPQRTLRGDLAAKHPRVARVVDDLIVYAPAFLLTELTEAFEIGFMVFIPFLVIDLVVGNVLLAMGMQMLSPQTIALPLKLLLFVAIGGWQLIVTGLVTGYA